MPKSIITLRISTSAKVSSIYLTVVPKLNLSVILRAKERPMAISRNVKKLPVPVGANSVVSSMSSVCSEVKLTPTAFAGER
jgi:hypothetical protein